MKIKPLYYLAACRIKKHRSNSWRGANVVSSHTDCHMWSSTMGLCNVFRALIYVAQFYVLQLYTATWMQLTLVHVHLRNQSLWITASAMDLLARSMFCRNRYGWKQMGGSWSLKKGKKIKPFLHCIELVWSSPKWRFARQMALFVKKIIAKTTLHYLHLIFFNFISCQEWREQI